MIKMAALGHHNEGSLAEFVHYYFKKTFEIDNVIDGQLVLFITACENYVKLSPRCLLFSKQLGLSNKEEAPIYDVKETDFILSVINELVKLGDLKPKPVKGKKKKDNINILPDILRANAVAVTNTLLNKFHYKNCNNCIIRLKSISGTAKGNRYIDVDVFLLLIVDAWRSIRVHWEDHAKYLFKEHCGAFTILSELQYANDQGNIIINIIVHHYDCYLYT